LKNTVDYYVDYNDIKKVLENMQNLAAFANSSVHLKEDLGRIAQLKELLIDYPES
jgi:hypothetical protein